MSPGAPAERPTAVCPYCHREVETWLRPGATARALFGHRVPSRARRWCAGSGSEVEPGQGHDEHGIMRDTNREEEHHGIQKGQ